MPLLASQTPGTNPSAYSTTSTEVRMRANVEMCSSHSCMCSNILIGEVGANAFQNSRSGSERYSHAGSHEPYKNDAGDWVYPSDHWVNIDPNLDWADWELYQHALSIFQANLAKANLPPYNPEG
eukprot:m.31468 g.31468  ORF g.31468 m.31468 type:complete len:124 (-) comp5360_c0_seq2:115-486(-)